MSTPETIALLVAIYVLGIIPSGALALRARLTVGTDEAVLAGVFWPVLLLAYLPAVCAVKGIAKAIEALSGVGR